MIDLKAEALYYFYLFSMKNLSALENLFADNCVLRDWENKAEGKADVVSVYAKIFNSVSSIAVTPAALYQDGYTVLAELLITIDGKEQIFVTDIITFNEMAKISSVRAYKG